MTKVAILLGAGSSIPAGFPSTEELTNMFLCGYGIWRNSQGEYFIEYNPCEDRRRYLSLEPRLDLVKSVIRWLYEATQEYHRTFQGRQANYEDVFYLAEQISSDIYGERENPAIYPFIRELESKFDDAVNSSIDNDHSMASYDLSSISTEVCNCVRDIIRNRLSLEVHQASHLEIVKYIYEKYNTTCIATLSHDTHVETFLKEQGVELIDGVLESNGKRNWNGNFIMDGKMPFYKLHGSINWDWDCSSYNFNRPEMLVGTFNKLAEYGSGIFLDLHYHFKTTIHEADTMIICGYSFGDKGINSTIINWYSDKRGRRFVIIHPCPEQLIRNARPAIWRLFCQEHPVTGQSGVAVESITYIRKKLQHVNVDEILDAIAS